MLYRQTISIPFDNKCIPTNIMDYSCSQHLYIRQPNFHSTIQEKLALLSEFGVIA